MQVEDNITQRVIVEDAVTRSTKSPFPAHLEFDHNRAMALIKEIGGVSDDLYKAAVDPSQPFDNRDAAWAIMLLQGFRPGHPTWERVTQCFLDGSYKYFDGKSHPIWWMRVSAWMRPLNLERDIYAFPHDRGYFIGALPGETDYEARLKHDRYYLDDHRSPVLANWKACAEYRALRIGAGPSWNRHKGRRDTIEGYGTIEWLRTVPPVTLRKYGFRVPEVR